MADRRDGPIRGGPEVTLRCDGCMYLIDNLRADRACSRVETPPKILPLTVGRPPTTPDWCPLIAITLEQAAVAARARRTHGRTD
jgi:hypothetical protein